MPKAQRWVIVKTGSFTNNKGRIVPTIDYYRRARVIKWTGFLHFATEYKTKEAAEKVACTMVMTEPMSAGSIFVKSRVRALETR